MRSIQNNQEEDLKRAETLLQQAKPNIELTIFDESTIAALKETMGLFEKWEVEEKMAEVYQYWGLYLFEKEDFENAKTYYQKSLDFRLRMYGEKHEQVGETYLSLGNLHTTLNDFSTAKKHLDKAMEISLALFGEQHLLTSKCYDGISGLLFEEEKHYESIKYQEKALEIAENLDHCPLFYMGKLYTNIGVDYSSVSNYYLSKHYLEKASSIFQRILPPTHKQFGAIYYTLSNAHRNTLNYNMALVFKQKALAVFESEPTNYLYAAYAYNGLQGLYVQLNKPEQAIEVGQKALKLLDRIGMRENGLTVAVLLNLGGNYGEHKKNLEKSLVYLQEALQKAITIYGPESSYVANVYVRIGRSYRDNNQYSKALTYLEKALEISEKLNDSHSVLRIEIIREISNIYFFRTNPDYLLSLQYVHQEYSFSLEGYENSDIYDFPFLDIQKNPFKIRTSEEALLQTIKDHAFVFFDYYRYVTKALKDLEASHKGFGIAIRMADYSRQSFQLEASKLVISKKMQVAMRRAFRVVHTLYEVTNREAYLQDAFKLAEKDKAYLLLLAHQEKNKAEIFNSANALLKTETLLKNKLTGLQKNIQFQEQKENEGLLRQYQNEYFDASVEFEALKKRIKKEHPLYYNQKYSTETVSIAALQSTLAENQTVLSYFIGEEKIYLFAVTPDEYEVFALDKPDNWEGLIQRYLQSIKFNQKDTFQQLSFELYQTLLQEAVHHLIDPFEEEVKQVFIIPHAELHYLPFESLLISEADTSTPYNELDYLLNHCQISYHYSATLLQLDLQKQSNAIAEAAPADFAFTGFAPVYESTSDNQKLAIQQLQNKEEAYATAVNRSEAVRSDGTWIPLPYSKIEVENIVQLFEEQGHKSQQFLYESATKNNLEQQIGKSRFVLIAAHGIVNDDYPELSGLVLADDGGREQEFGVSEESLDLVTNSPSFEKHGDIRNGNDQKIIEDCILNMKEVAMIPMSADLVVLSSCESGIGELHKGEGMMAVNRGFLASGAKNVVSTLFKVNDKASSELTQLLFVHILKGENYSVALQKAKLELLEREKMSPKMWSGFVLFGKGE